DPLPVAGLVLLAAVGGTVLIRRSSPRPAVVLACVTLLLAVPLALLTRERNRVVARRPRLLERRRRQGPAGGAKPDELRPGTDEARQHGGSRARLPGSGPPRTLTAAASASAPRVAPRPRGAGAAASRRADSLSPN